MTVLGKEDALVISADAPTSPSDMALSVPVTSDKKALRRKKGKVFATSVDTLKLLIDQVNEQQDHLVEQKRAKEQENEKNFAARIEKYEAKRNKKRQILDKVKERMLSKKKRTEEAEAEQTKKKEDQNQKKNDLKRSGNNSSSKGGKKFPSKRISKK